MASYFRSSFYKKILSFIFSMVILITIVGCGHEPPHPPINCGDEMNCVDFQLIHADPHGDCLPDPNERSYWTARNYNYDWDILVTFKRKRTLCINGKQLPDGPQGTETVPRNGEFDISTCSKIEEEVAGSHREVCYTIEKVTAKFVTPHIADLHSLEDCESQCQEGSSPAECLTINLRDVPILGQGLRELYKLLFNDTNFPITKEKLMVIFGQHTDPCNRSDTDLRGKNIINTGERCQIPFSGPIGSLGEIKGSIITPPTLEIARQVTGDKIILVPNQQVGTTWLIFTNENQNKSFGGPIYKVVMKIDGVIIQTENGCVRINY